MLQVFESHAGILGPDLFMKFSLPCLRKIAEGVKCTLTDKGIPVVPMVSSSSVYRLY